MLEVAQRLLAFLIVGGATWWLSLRFPMKEYPAQPVSRFDLGFLPLALLLAEAVDLTFDPLLEPLAQPIVAGLRRAATAAGLPAGDWPVTVRVLLYLVSTDFLGYWAHRAMHSKALWRVHAFHHSARSLNWVSGMRGSPLHMVLIFTPGILMAAIFLHANSRAAFYTVMAVEMLSQHLTHSNIRLPRARWWEGFVVTPRMHFLHHHRDAAHGDMNYGFYFSLWDHLFGTYVDADTVTDLGQLGLHEDYTIGSLIAGLRLTESAPREP